MNNEQSTGQRFRLRDASWLTIGLALLTVVTFFAVSGPRGQYGIPMMMGVSGWAEDSGSPTGAPSGMISPQSADTGGSSAPSQGMMRPDYYPYPGNNEVDATDTREFLKVYYNATMRTRDVPGLTRRVETTVRGYDGRVDQQSSSDKYGSVSFALPQSKYEAFRTELESLVGSRFLRLNISSQNMLSQKVSIEEQQKQADTTLAGYQKTRQNIVSAHASAVASLQVKINAATSTEKIALQQQLASENARYTTQLRNADANIKYAQEWQKAVETQDAKLLANVATVTGTVSIQWISLWDMAQLYLPGYWIPAIFAALALASFYRDRRRVMSPEQG